MASIPPAGARGEEMGNKRRGGGGRGDLRRRSGASDAGIHLIALK